MLTGRVAGVVDSIADLAARASLPFEVVHPAAVVERPPPRTLGPAHPAFERLLRWPHPDAFRVLLSDVRVAGADPVVLTADRRALRESAFDRDQLERNPVMHQRLVHTRRRRERHLLLAGPWAHNHFHWFLDLLPRAALLPLDEEPDAPVLVPPGLTATQVASLDRIGIPAERRRSLPRTLPAVAAELAVDELWFPSMAGGTGNPPTWAVDWLRERLALDTPPGPRERLYVSRADAHSRRVVDEPALEALLRRYGFVPFLPGGFPLQEQLARFAAAEVIVGAHGAGLTGLLAARDATVVELFEPGYVNGCFYALSAAAGLDYWYVLGAPAEEGGIRVDLAAVERTLAAAGLDARSGAA